MGFGAELKKILQNRGMKVTHLARITGIPVNTLYAIISRDSNNVSVSTTYKIVKALDLDSGDIAILDMCLHPEKWGDGVVQSFQKSEEVKEEQAFDYTANFEDRDYLLDMLEKAKRLENDHDRELLTFMIETLLNKAKGADQ